MGIQILLNIQTMKTAIILTFLGMFGSLTDACCKHSCNNGNNVSVSGIGGRMGSPLMIPLNPWHMQFVTLTELKDSLGLKLTYVKQCIARTSLLTAQRKLTLTFLMPMEMES